MSGHAGGHEAGGGKLPPAPKGWDGAGALAKAMEQHVLADGAHASDGDAYHAALGSIVLSYLQSLPPKTHLTALLVLKGVEGYPEEKLLAAADDEAERLATLEAARELHAEGKLRRQRGPDGTVFWRPSGPLLPDPDPEPRDRPASEAAARRRPGGTNDDGPQTGGSEM